MRLLIESALRSTADTFQSRVECAALEHWYESDFRLLVIEHMLRERRELKIEAEWSEKKRRTDLLVFSGATAALIEFKWFLVRKSIELPGKPSKRKGYPCDANVKEARGACAHLATLRSASLSLMGSVQRYLTLIHTKEYASWYPGLNWLGAETKSSALNIAEFTTELPNCSRSTNPITFRLVEFVPTSADASGKDERSM